MTFKGLYKVYLVLASFSSVHAATVNTPKVIERDVIIIGGGAAGSHAAFRLQQDYNKSIVLIEKESILGGHVDTYLDTSTTPPTPREYGVQVYFPYLDGLDFISRFNLTLLPGLGPRGSTTTRNIDFSTGLELPSTYTGPDPSSITSAIIRFHNLMVSQGWDKMIEPGFWNLPPGPQIPEDLLLPIGEFAKKWNITEALPRMYESTGGGPASRHRTFTDILTLTFLQSFSPAWMKVLYGQVGMYHIQGGNQLLYEAIHARLGAENVLLNSLVSSVRRPAENADDKRGDIEVAISTSTTSRSLHVSRNEPTTTTTSTTTMIRARKLLLAIPPTQENLAPFDLDSLESNLFSRAKYGRYGTAIVSSPVLPRGYELHNTPILAAIDPNKPFINEPHVLEFASYGNDSKLFSIGTSGSGLGYGEFDEREATKVAQESLERMVDAGTVKVPDGKEPGGDQKLKVVEYSDHGPGGFGVSAEEMKGGWMEEMYGLQGKRGTWYTGNAIAIDFSTQLWKMNDEVLRRMLESW
ncbi:hypothetical protein NEUTE1DRAFT_127079 [Neurospora tetrasperma FGSC 2508]|uniref:FAD/NAD(P)-binding domain-containing protein n=1 Tax=Neurospora tetrasperma (strain FGSC 2508 / ATCC MYA-4615 / P0657) TaxID=510951 RepID=F8MAJ8_NEUT8|nr:uncharacterized protein NEUTE1DRAFT_127079 [Neurospora tetrasperma FGSC 2508]EGO60119.1 hypothetical protein NEUTE1DRAFT_127079 [Neurospora tetrasperma FGSC 2508]EGZ75931.1 hypothetical protein NEUTE2DRAFT_106273 [Neurospora tetrasperma FGSC 2509]